MKEPSSLVEHKIGLPKSKPGLLEQRFGKYNKGAVLPETTIPCCPRRKVSDFPEGFLKQGQIEKMEQNQTLPHCCRHPENHEVEALKSHPSEEAPDIYIFHCKCGNKHRFLCVGLVDTRPEWK